MLGVKIHYSQKGQWFVSGTAYDPQTASTLITYCQDRGEYGQVMLEFPEGHRRECSGNEARIDLHEFYTSNGRSEGIKAS